MARESWGRRKMEDDGLSHGLFRILFALEWVVLPVVLSAPKYANSQSRTASATVDAEEELPGLFLALPAFVDHEPSTF